MRRRGDRFAESLEIEATGLEMGKYELTWIIRDIQSGQSHEQQMRFEVVEEYPSGSGVQLPPNSATPSEHVSQQRVAARPDHFSGKS